MVSVVLGRDDVLVPFVVMMVVVPEIVHIPGAVISWRVISLVDESVVGMPGWSGMVLVVMAMVSFEVDTLGSQSQKCE